MVISIVQMPCATIAITGVCHRGCTFAADARNAPFFAIA